MGYAYVTLVNQVETHVKKYFYFLKESIHGSI